MVVRKKNTRTRGRRKIGRKSPVTKRNTLRTRRARQHSADALDGAILIGSGITTAMKDAFFQQTGANLMAGIYSGAVTGLVLQGETDPNVIVRRAAAIVDAAHDFMKSDLRSRGVVITATEPIPASEILTGAYDPSPNDPNTTDNTDRA